MRKGEILIIVLSCFIYKPSLLVAAELISSGLCRQENFSSSSRSCKPGHLLRGNGITFDHLTDNKVILLSTARSTGEEELIHVWFFNGKRMPQERPTVYIEKEKSFLENVSEELAILSEKKNVGAIAAIASIVKLAIKPSVRFRTWSSKNIGPEWVGKWEVEIYDESDTNPLCKYSFTVK